MGYCVDIGCDVTIKKENLQACLEAINGLNETGNYAWVVGPDGSKYQTIEEAFRAWRYDTWVDADGNFSIIGFTGQKWGDDETLYKTIAPFAEGEIRCHGEDGENWAYKFEGGKLYHGRFEIIWE
jgi:hypothetical protein